MAKKHQPIPTQKDIAKALGLSQASVAYALSPKSRGKLPPETVHLIEAKATELNYRPQRQASILRSGRSHTIGAIFCGGVYHAPQERVKYLAQYAIRAGYQLVAMDIDWFGKDIRAAQNYLTGSAVEGIVVCNLYADPNLNWDAFFIERSLPVVSLGTNFESNIDRVRSDMKESFRQMTEHHLELGSRNLTLLLPFYDRPADRDFLESEPALQRAEGFAEAIAEAGGNIVSADTTNEVFLDFCQKYPHKKSPITGTIIHPTRPDDVEDAFELGYVKMSQIIRSGAPLPDSMICSNDQVATGAINACLQNGIAVPGDIRISGADNAPFSRFCGVPLTTIAQPSVEMSQWAIQRIVQVIENPTLRNHPEIQTFPCKIIPRASTIGTPTLPPRKLNGSALKVKGFSLVELLVTIAILAVLLALGSAGFSAAKGSAQNSKCISNLRASGTAMHAYFQDRNGNFFGNKNWYQYPSTKSGVNNGMREYFGIKSDTTNVDSPEFYLDTILTCPAMKAKYPHLYPQGMNRGFAINYYLFQKDPASKYDSGPSADRPPLPGAPQNIRNVPKVSAMWILTDSAINGGLLGSINESTAAAVEKDNTPKYLSMPHKGRQNVLFLDGHIESLDGNAFRNPPSKREFWSNLNYAEGT